MDNTASLAHSAQCLKKAIPLMVKYKMAVTPINYAIWYCYVQGDNPQLNLELDRVIGQHNTCSAQSAQEIFDKYINDEELAFFQQMSERFHNTVEQVQFDLSDSIQYSKSFTSSLVDSQNELKTLSSINSFNEILSCVERLTDESIAMQDYARGFQTKLAQAYNEIKDLKEALTMTQEAVDKDSLTGLLNRGKFDTDIVEFCLHASSQDEQAKIAVLIMLDIDHFKRFNDDFGHQKGDEVLKLVAQKVQNSVQDEYNAYRYGGEEFCITGYFDSINDAMTFCNQLRLSIAKLTIRKKEDSNNKRNISASFGIALMEPFSKSCLLVEKADRALYLAKTHGRNRVEIAANL
ncbi:GGDEF domain-containing protein [Pseudoalteromonas sp. APC 3224]|uniref:GGDEF domain-containing protein n=1 Tax=Pseudoalteromonas sp. APC 3224 TaxID=3035203 RepID=UPI0025B5734B|nr:GGDEF domain-containing protein [Pseudoalteromonas sp. APC 3224]MDN3485327.1 GGDEF domain-containing protein [Pseudoalteromonas sp. APC 3224]